MHVAGKLFTGPKPAEQLPTPPPSAIRQIANNLPVKDVSSPALTCGLHANVRPATEVATIPAGSTLTLGWETLTASGFWFHDVGPMMAYLADCGGSCVGFDPGVGEARWFKITEVGMEGDGTWAQAKLDTGAPANITLPPTLKAGNYLLRHEIIALHTAQSLGGAEFYVGCVQLAVTGSGHGVPAPSELVRIPGAYGARDEGILVDVYDMQAPYVFPGPKVAAFVSSGSDSGAPGSGAKSAAPKTKTRNPTSESPLASATSTEAHPASTSTSTHPSHHTAHHKEHTHHHHHHHGPVHPTQTPECKAKRERRRASGLLAGNMHGHRGRARWF
uniref:lytic cellulose monooxygenase (C4-dehydrogenating) n=1 Tax=Mycena chlorophos TaxID=658473 RepID=A0ABQ0LEP0_MYCCL|nr:predicted protein [Mycena chlorophos]